MHYTLDTMQNIELCRCLCNENNVVTKDNVTTTESDVTCKNCLKVLKRNQESYLKQRMGRIKQRMGRISDETEHKKMTEERLKELSEQDKTKMISDDIKIFKVLNNIVLCLLNTDDLHDDKKVVKILVTKTFDDKTYESQTIDVQSNEEK